MARIILAFVVLATAARSADTLDEVRSGFTYRGQPVHAGIVELFSNGMADSADPQVLAVDLSTAQGSNRFDEASCARNDAGWLRTVRHDADDHSEFAYRYIGSLPSGTIVLHTCESGGGSGMFESAMLLAAVHEDAIGDDGANRTRDVLRVLRTVVLGDRAAAVLRITGATVEVDRARAKFAEMRTPMTIRDPQESERKQPR